MKPAYEYKGYLGSAEVSVEDNLVVGRLLFIPDVVSYVAEKPSDLEKAFREAVDDYLQLCQDVGDEPSVPCKGSFNVRTGADRHRKVATAAISAEVSLNDWVCSAIDLKLEGEHVTNHVTVNLYGSKIANRIATAGPVAIWDRVSTSAGTARTLPH